jgi:branched-subunit amino acid permease
MEDFSIWHWVIIFVMLIAAVASPVLGIVRSVKNGAVISAVISVCVPVYGLIYFFAAKRP